jgi:hypothetical protein
MALSARDSLHDTALAQFKFIAETEHDQRARELEALRFQAGDQWTEDAKLSRAGLPANASTGSPAVPARPMLTMRTLDQPIAQVVNQEHDADLAITITAKDGKANKDTAEVIAGLIRAIQTDSHADDVYSWGFQRMVGCGRGYWRVNKAYANERAGLDQVIRIEPIENGFSVYRDPLPKWQPNGGFWEPDYTFVTADLPEADYKREFGASKLANASDSEILEGLGDDLKHWVIEGDAGKTYRVAEYWFATYKPATASDGRPIQVRTIMWAKMNGVEWLEPPQEWDGHFIPIIEDTGNKYNVGGNTIIEGMVQPAISPCRMLNFMVSSAAENIGIESLAPWLVVAGQLQGYEPWWNQANVRNFPFLEYNATTAGTGQQLLPPPTRNNRGADISAYGEMIGLFTNFIRSTTGVPDAALGHVNPNDRSGKAIEELKVASQQGTSGWMTHHARAIRQTGIVVVDLLPSVYDRPGRVERIIGKDGAEDWVMLNQPFVKGQDGQPQPAPQAGMMQRVKSAIGMGGPQPMAHMLADGQYGVIVNVGKSRQTMQQETFAGMNALAQAAPELVPRFADLWVESMGIPKADQIAARIRPPGVDDENSIPPEAQAKMAQMQAVIQELQQVADDNRAKVAIAETNAKAKLAEAQQNNQTKLQEQQQDDQTRIRVAGIQAQAQVAVADIKAMSEDLDRRLRLMETLIGVKHDSAMQARTQAHDAEKTVHQTLAGERAADSEYARAREMRDIEHSQQVDLASMPPPVDPNRMADHG